MCLCGIKTVVGLSANSTFTENHRTGMPFVLDAKWIRPAWWGFCISTGVAALLLVVQLIWHRTIESDWTNLKASRENDLAELVQARVHATILEQARLAERVLREPDIQKAFREQTPAMLSSAFQRLESHREEESLSLDVVDTSGHIILWAGRSVRSKYPSAGIQGTSEELVLVTLSGLHRFLSVGKSAGPEGPAVFVSSPLETNYPLSNRFVSQLSLAQAFRRETGVAIEFTSEVSSKDTAGDLMFAVPVSDRNQRILTTALIPVPTIAGEEAKTDRWLDRGVALAVAVAILFLGVVLARKFMSDSGFGHRRLLLIPVLWLVRLGWRTAGFPSAFGGGFLFDPAVHSSPFPLGLAGSLGELTISAVCMLLTFGLVFRSAVQWYGESRRPERKLSRRSEWLVLALTVPIIIGFQWVVRGYGAAVRSFVFDSTIRYLDPVSLLPGAEMAVMHFSILMLTLALVAAVGASFIMVSRFAGKVLTQVKSRLARTSLVTTAFVAGYGVYLLIDWPGQIPFVVPLILYAYGAFLLFLTDHPDATPPFLRRGGASSVAILLAAGFVIAVISLDVKTHEKERERVKILAEELLRPADTWLSFVISESVRAATTKAAEQLVVNGSDSTFSIDLAFNLWAQTLLSKEGYSSALVVYGRTGKEISRFAVGLSSYDQMELLTELFHREEDALLVVDRKGVEGTTKYYGQWEHVLDSQVQPIGTIAIVMSASQRSLFRGEAPEQLRTTSSSRIEDLVRPTFISEYRGGELWSTNDPVLFRGMPLPREIAAALQSNTARFVWSEQDVEGNDYEILYVRDDSDSSRVLSIGIRTLGLRWHLFGIVKTLLVYALFLALAVAVMLARESMKGISLRFGFREKLGFSFAVLSLLPLLLMAYYDRQLAVARLDENITRRLSQELDLIQQRFISAVLDEDDFNSGVTNDFCEAIASDYGIDFSVYESSELKASSRPELYRASILDCRLTGTAFGNAMTLGRGFYKSQERVGEINYFVGYRPIVIGGGIRGVLAVPALYRQQEIDEELAQRNAFVLGAYAFVVVLVIGMAIVLAHTLSKPLRDLSKAARSVGKGDLDVVLQAKSADEVGDLIRSFNEMTSELKASRKNLARAEREMAWKEMAKQVAHEIKNPLTPIKLSIQHLVQAYRQGTKDFGDILQRVSQTVIEQIEVLTRIASEFSDFARMPARTFERVDLNQLVAETVNLFKEVQGIDVHARPCARPAHVIADKDELRRVFINIVRNSIQAMEKGGVVSIEMEVEHEVCKIRFSDTGAGIPENLQEKVFQPNFSTKTDGMGLGLAIARKVIEDLNGTISLKSTVGVGTDIEIRIPLR